MQADEHAFDAACQMPGFAEDSKQPTSKRIPLSVFKELCFKWERRLTFIALACLAKADAFVVRSMLLFLKRVVEVRPSFWCHTP